MRDRGGVTAGVSSTGTGIRGFVLIRDDCTRAGGVSLWGDSGAHERKVGKSGRITPPEQMGQKQREELLGRLLALRTGESARTFVLLWTYFETVGLQDAESAVDRKYTDRDALERYGVGRNSLPPTRILDALVTDAAEFDLRCLRWLKGLDDVLQRQNGTFDGTVTGFDRRQYWIRRRNDFIANQYASNASGLTTADLQGGTLRRYCRTFVVILAEHAGLTVECKAERRWGDGLLHERLKAARREFRTICWPLSRPLELRNGPPTHLSVTTAGETTAAGELQRAIDAAQQHHATFLIFPELSLSPDDLVALHGLLASRDVASDFPVLTLAGVTHQPSVIEGLEVNEAVLLGADGEILHRHTKMYPFEAAGGAIERLEVGRKLSVLESPIGNITPLICLEFFNFKVAAVLQQSHANIFLVPSLSETTGAHEITAVIYRAHNGGTTLLSNRDLEGDYKAARRTFYSAPGKRLDRPILQYLVSGDRYLTYELEFPGT